MLEVPQGAGVVEDPVRPEGRVKVPGRRPAAKLTKQLSDRIVRSVAKRLDELRTGEFKSINEVEWDGAIEAACSTLAALAPLTIAEAIATDLLPDAIAAKAIASDPQRVKIAGLSDNGEAVYRRLLAESSSHVIEFISQRPDFRHRIDVELIRRTAKIQVSIDEMQESIDDLRSRRSVTKEEARFEARYAEIVGEKLDKVQLIGLTSQQREEYSLSTAYLSLSASSQPSLRSDRGAVRNAQDGQRQRIEDILAGVSRILIRGEAGSGKTTLLQWLAINSVKDDGKLPEYWQRSVPFLITLRRIARRDFPGPDQFVRLFAPALAGEAPEGWVQRVLRSGRGLILVDGVDELPSAKQADMWSWLGDLITTYPESRYVITSRPPTSYPPASDTFRSFRSFLLLPMRMPDVTAFVHHWHSAMREPLTDPEQAANIVRLERDLLEKLAQRRDLRRLATNPLLCAVICTLHLDRYRQLPRDRMGLYHAALEMLLVRRDEARAIIPDVVALSQPDQEALLAQLAYWLVRNARSDADRSEATARLAKYLKSMPHIAAKASEVMKQLLLRSGILREPVMGRIDFIHKTFQEYLAARALLDEGDLDALIQNAREEHWRQVVVMAVGHARRDERERIISSLLHNGDQDAVDRSRLHLLAAACLEHNAPLDQELVARVKARTAALIPPKSLVEADQLASAGEVILDLIPDPASLSADGGLAILRVLDRFDIEDTLTVLSRMATCPHTVVREQLASAWPALEPAAYVDAVLENMKIDDVRVQVFDGSQLDQVARLSLHRLTAMNVEGDLVSLANHKTLSAISVVKSEVENLEPLASCANLRNVALVGVRCRAGLVPLINGNVRELALLGGGAYHGERPAEDEYILVASAMPSLEKLTFDLAFAPSDILPAARSVTDLRLLSSAWMADVLADQEYVIGSLKSSVAFNWRRPSFTPFVRWRSLKMVTLAGWPRPGEIHVLRELGLADLRLIVANDELRARTLADGSEYPYPVVSEGFVRTIGQLPDLRSLEVLTLNHDQISPTHVRWDPSGTKNYPRLSSGLASRIRSLRQDVRVTVNGQLVSSAK